MELIDIGINLTHESFSHDLDAVLHRARDAGVVQMMVTGTTVAGSEAAVRLARAHPRRLYATAGVHPHHAAEMDEAGTATLNDLLQQPEILAVGECGLDYYRNYAPRAAQLDTFARQLECAAACGKPLFLHQRDAHEDFLALLRRHPESLRGGGVAHCFTGGARELEDCLELGLAIGITGWICDERRGLGLRELVTRIPVGKLLLETDAPYLLPRDLRPRRASRRNEPAYLAHIAAVVAQLRGESLQECAAHTTATAHALFGLPSL